MTEPHDSTVTDMAEGLRGGAMGSVAVTDLYEAAYLVLSGCNLEAVSCLPVSESLVCRLEFTGPGIASAQEAFWEKSAVVNLHAFRSAYGQVNSYVHQAKKSFDRERRYGRHGAV